ncbi:hypothetical protein [Streptomyces sp. NPDC047928]|uniref:hypothetical protein n=1 Tax=unclassified Streptomyces TaxID=2593676 RepID=UPI003712F3AA
MSFEDEWAHAKADVVQRREAGTRLNQLPAEAGSSGAANYKVIPKDLQAVGNEAQELFHGFEAAAFHAGAQTGTAATSLDQDGFKTGSGMWTAWDKWRTQCETLLSACAHIHNHLEYTIADNAKGEEVLISNFSISKVDKHFS